MKKFLLVIFSFAFVLNAWAQERAISGKVTAVEDGLALPGVNVVLKGTTVSTVTDANGKFSLSVPATGGTLVLSFIGFKSQEQEVGERSVIDVQLETDVTQLSEVVVNAIGDETPKDKLGSSSATVGGSAVVSSGETGLINGMAGKAPGLTITRNGGDPGAGSYIQLRGQSTITGDLQPLIVIDGMPMYNSSLTTNSVGDTQQQSRLNDLNPNDIASIEVIASASGAALWGSRAANGVIVIKTKKGKNTHGKLNITYAGTVSVDKVNKMPELQTTFGQGLNGNYGYGSSSSYGDIIAARAGGADTPSGTAYAQFPDGTKRFATASGTAANPHGGKNSTETFDHRKDVFRTGHYIEHDITLSGGNDRSQFYLSYDNLSQQGIIKASSDYNKNGVRVNFSTALTDKLHVTTNADFTNVTSNRIQQGSNISGLLLGQLRTAPDFDNTNYIGTYYNASGLATLGSEITYRSPIGASGPGYDNPLWTIHRNKSYDVVNRFLGNVELTYDVLDWLSLRGNSGIDTYTERRSYFGDSRSAANLGGSYTEQYIQESQWNTNLYATAKKTFSDKFFGSFLVGFNYNTRQFNNVGANITQFIIPDAPPNLSNANPANSTPFNAANTVKTSAGFAQINAEYANQLFLAVTGRAESASTFGPLAQSLFYYPSASLAWQFSKMTGTNDFFSFGKLRTSYGVVGKQPDPYLNQTLFGITNYTDAYGGTLVGSNYGVGGYSISTIAGNQHIRPERKHEFEVGTDLRFFGDKVSFSATAYTNKTTDVILQTQVAPSSGFTNTIANAGVIQNKGLELSLGVTWLRLSNGFTWSSNAIWSAYRNKVVDLAGAQYVFLAGFTDGSSVATKGQPLGTLWGSYYDRGSDGKLILDSHGFPTVAASPGAIGNPNPNYRASLGNTFTYKGFNLYVLFEAMVGGQMWNGTRGALVNFGVAKSTDQVTKLSAADAATIVTDDGHTIAALAASSANTLHNRATVNADGSYSFRGTVTDFGGGKVAVDQYWNQNGGSGFLINQPFVESMTWARLREVTLSYSLNSAAFRTATKLQSVTFGVTGRNLFLWTPYKGIDPDTNLTGTTNGRGIDYFQNPNTRSILFKLLISY
jgi:TonB-linked SusC/RagA family outer membrane protein